MTFNEATTPNTDTKTAPQTSRGDPLDLSDIPTFLRRSPQPAKPADAKGD